MTVWMIRMVVGSGLVWIAIGVDRIVRGDNAFGALAFALGIASILMGLFKGRGRLV